MYFENKKGEYVLQRNNEIRDASIISFVNEKISNINNEFIREELSRVLKENILSAVSKIFNRCEDTDLKNEDYRDNCVKELKRIKKTLRYTLLENDIDKKEIIEVEDLMDEIEENMQLLFRNDIASSFHLALIKDIKGICFLVYYNGEVQYLNSRAVDIFGSSGYNSLEEISNIVIEIEKLSNENNSEKYIEYNLDDKHKWIELNINKLSLLGEDVKVIIVNDISERKIIEEQLRKSEEKYKALLEMLPDSVYVTTEKGIEYANNAALDMFGYESIDDIKGKYIYELLRVPYKYQSLVQQQNDLLNRNKRLMPVERKYIRIVDNKMLEVETTATIIKSEDNEMILNISRNIEMRKRMQSLKERVNEKTLMLKEAKRYDEIKNEFFANISHEFRTPINVILGVIQLIENIDKDADNYLSLQSKISKYIGITKQNCYRLIRLVNNLIDITKIDAGYMKFDSVNLDIINVVENICMSVVEYMKSKEIDLIFDTEVEEKIICVDPDKIERIILNILANAVKFTNPGGQVYVDIYDNDEYIEISIKDTGIGIPEEKQKTIFNRFVQVERTLSRNREGSGIGLSLVKAFVEMHDGELSVKSEVGKGSEFIIKLPSVIGEIEEREESNYREYLNIESINIEFSDIYS